MEIKLVEEGISTYTIVLPKAPTEIEKQAARELQECLKDVSGATLPIITADEGLSDHMILLGYQPALWKIDARIDPKQLGDEGYAIKTVGHHLVISSGDGQGMAQGLIQWNNGVRSLIYEKQSLGVLYGVYAFMEDELGCRWYAPKDRHIPRHNNITIDDLDIVSTPDFEYRHTYYTPAFDSAWGNWLRRTIPPYDNRVHTFCLMVPEDRYLKDHPEYFSLINGERKGGQYVGQLCLTNPEVLRICREEVLKWVEQNPGAKIFSVSQNDNSRSCECDRCKAIDREEGSPSGTLLRFVNAIADEVAGKHPDVWIDTLAYMHTEKPPQITRPKPNVRIRLCPIYVCQYHPYEVCDDPATKAFMENLSGWSKLTSNIDIWHYSSVYGHLLAPLPDLEQLAANFAMYKRMGVRSLFVEGNDMPGAGGWMDELKSTLIAKLQWDLNTDVKAVTDNFMSVYFGKSGAPIGRWVWMLHEQIHARDLHGSCWPERDYKQKNDSRPPANPYLYLPLMSTEVINESDRLFDEAEKLAEDPVILSRVQHARLSLEYVKVMFQLQEALSGTLADRDSALARYQEFIRRCKVHGIQHLELVDPIDATVDQVWKMMSAAR
ncbi:MAG: DUF4838 domain-containing protein [Phycisphaerales bacterium]|nr:DUF4838 domain-containing protein [Phycisphaerales bacterium]